MTSFRHGAATATHQLATGRVLPGDRETEELSDADPDLCHPFSGLSQSWPVREAVTLGWEGSGAAGAWGEELWKQGMGGSTSLLLYGGIVMGSLLPSSQPAGVHLPCPETPTVQQRSLAGV